MSKNPREILGYVYGAILRPEKEGKQIIDEALIDLDKYYTELDETPQYILSLVEIDKDWVKDLLLMSNLVGEEGAERIAEGIKMYSPIRRIMKKCEHTGESKNGICLECGEET